MEILGFEPKAFPMRKGRSTTELHSIRYLLICVPHFKLFSLGFLDKVLKDWWNKNGFFGFWTQGIPYKKGMLYHWAMSSTITSFLCLTIQAVFFRFLKKGFEKRMKIKMEILGFKPKDFPKLKGHFTTELHPLHSLFPLSYNPNCILSVFGKGFEKRME